MLDTSKAMYPRRIDGCEFVPAKKPGAVQIVADAFVGQHRQRLGHAIVEHLRHLPEAAVKPLPVDFHLGVFVFGWCLGHGLNSQPKVASIA